MNLLIKPIDNYLIIDEKIQQRVQYICRHTIQKLSLTSQTNNNLTIITKIFFRQNKLDFHHKIIHEFFKAKLEFDINVINIISSKSIKHR